MGWPIDYPNDVGRKLRSCLVRARSFMVLNGSVAANCTACERKPPEERLTATLSVAVAIFCTFAHTARACPGGAHDILREGHAGARAWRGEWGAPKIGVPESPTGVTSLRRSDCGYAWARTPSSDLFSTVGRCRLIVDRLDRDLYNILCSPPGWTRRRRHLRRCLLRAFHCLIIERAIRE